MGDGAGEKPMYKGDKKDTMGEGDTTGNKKEPKQTESQQVLVA